MRAPLIHIGFHKTGSTLLQRKLFDRSDVGFVRLRDDRRRIHPCFIQYGPYAGPSEALIHELRSEVDAAAADGNALVVSHERLSGYPASGGFDSRLIADRLKQVFPEAKILITVREQRSMLKSFYLQYITDGGSLSLRKFLSRPQPSLHRMPGFDYAYFEYDLAVAYYQQLFGKGNVLVVPFERLNESAVAVAEAIVGFAGDPAKLANLNADIFAARENRAVPIVFQQFRRFCNAVFTRTQLSNHGFIDIPHFDYLFRQGRKFMPYAGALERWLGNRLAQKIEAATAGRYAQSNRRLAELTDIDFSRYGYDVSASQQ